MPDNDIYSFICKDLQRIILNTTTMWLNVLDQDAKVIVWNKAAEKISGYTREEVIGRSDIWELLYPDPDYRQRVYNKALEIIDQGEEVSDFETTIQRKDGQLRVLSWNSHNINDEQGNIIGSLALARDVTELHNSEQKLKKLARELEESNKHLQHLTEIDALTGLYNRRYMENILEYEWRRHIRNQAFISLIYIDIDFFKEYNDLYGHPAGDKALVKVSKIMKQSARRSTDKLVRFGGEEFALILPETTHDEVIAIAEKLQQDIIDSQITHLGSKISNILTISMGISTVKPTHSLTIEEFKKQADKMLYNAKTLGRNRIESI